MASDDVTLKTALELLLQSYDSNYHRLLSKSIEIQRRSLDGSFVGYIEDFVCLNFVDWLKSLPSNLRTDKALIKCKTALTNTLKIPQIQDKLSKEYCERTTTLINQLWKEHKQDEIDRRAQEPQENPQPEEEDALSEAPSEGAASHAPETAAHPDNVDITYITKMKNINKETSAQVKILQARCTELEKQIERTRFDAEVTLNEQKDQLQLAQDQNAQLIQDYDALCTKVSILEATKNDLETKLAQQTNLKEAILKIILQQQEIILQDDKFEKLHIAPFIHIYKQIMSL